MLYNAVSIGSRMEIVKNFTIAIAAGSYDVEHRRAA